MPTKLDVFLTIGFYPDSNALDLVKRMGKKATSYKAVHNLAKVLEAEHLVKNAAGSFSLINRDKASLLFWLLNFCFKNSIDYNLIVSEKTAEFVKRGLEKERVNVLPFDSRTVKKISLALSKHGFAVIESRKPFICRVVYSTFLERLCIYFNKKPKITCRNFTDCLNEKKLDVQLNKAFSDFRKLSNKRIDFNEINFIHSSLALEGNTLTLPETEKLIKENITPKDKPFKDAQQVIDYKKALDDFIYNKKEIILENILSFHKTAMNSLKAGSGEVRKQNVKIQGNPDFKTPDWKQVPGLLTNFFDYVKQFSEQKKLSGNQLVEKASFLHNEFQRIHPFIDGNSRTSRAIFIKFLALNNFPVINISIGFSEQYLNLTKASKKRDDYKLALLMKQISLENLKQANQKLEYT
jgi:Fic family protein